FPSTTAVSSITLSPGTFDSTWSRYRSTLSPMRGGVRSRAPGQSSSSYRDAESADWLEIGHVGVQPRPLRDMGEHRCAGPRGEHARARRWYARTRLLRRA